MDDSKPRYSKRLVSLKWLWPHFWSLFSHWQHWLNRLKGQFIPKPQKHILPPTSSAIYPPRWFWRELQRFWNISHRDVCSDCGIQRKKIEKLNSKVSIEFLIRLLNIIHRVCEQFHVGTTFFLLYANHIITEASVHLLMDESSGVTSQHRALMQNS